MILHENRLPADYSYEISSLICYFQKGGKIRNCCLLQIIGGALRVNDEAKLMFLGDIEIASVISSFSAS